MTSADFTIVEFLAWVRTKPAGQKYCYIDANSCAVAQFGLATDRLHLVNVRALWDLKKPWLHDAVRERGHTFGELVSRLEALLPAEPLSDTWTKTDAYLTDIEDVARERVTA